MDLESPPSRGPSPRNGGTRRMTRIAALLATMGTGLLVVFASSCGGGSGGSGNAVTPAAVIIVDGSSTVFRISRAARDAFNAENPGVNVVVDNHGTGGGFSRYLQGEVDIVDASRPAKSDEESRAKAQGIEWTPFVVGYDGITLVVNPRNQHVRSLSVDQLCAIWTRESKIKTW